MKKATHQPSALLGKQTPSSRRGITFYQDIDGKQRIPKADKERNDYVFDSIAQAERFVDMMMSYCLKIQ